MRYTSLTSTYHQPKHYELMSYHSFKSIQRQVNEILSQSSSNDNCIKVIKLCRKFLSNHKITSYNEQSINQIVKYKVPDVEGFLFEKIELHKRSSDVVRSYLVEKPVPHSQFILDAVRQNSDMELNRTALRQLLYKNKDIETSISLIKQNSSIFEKQEIKKFQIVVLSYFACSLSLHGLLEMVIMGHETMNVLLDFYFFNLFLMFSLLKTPKDDSISWRLGASFLQRNFNRYEYQMSRKLIQAYKELFSTNVSNYHMTHSKLVESFQRDMPEDKEKLEKLIRSKLREMGLMVRDDENEVMFKEYWDTGGDGFQWCEPDRDPVEFLDVTRGGSTSDKM